MPPWEGGGSMIATVSLSEGTTWTKAPWRFEAGTPNTGGIIGLGAALEYVSALGLNNIAEYEQNLMHYALSQLESVPDLTLYGPRNRLGVIAFNLGKHHAYDVGSFLDNYVSRSSAVGCFYPQITPAMRLPDTGGIAVAADITSHATRLHYVALRHVGVAVMYNTMKKRSPSSARSRPLG